MQITAKLRGHANQRQPKVKLWINRDCVYDGTLGQEQTFVFDVDNLLPTNIFGIEHHGKDDNETTSTADVAVELVSLAFNGLAVPDTVLYDKPYYVDWSEVWPGDRPEFIKNTLYFGWNGTYKFDFTGDIKRQYFRQFWHDEAQAHQNQNSDEFYRDGEFVAVDNGVDATIFDLERIIMRDKLG